ncbi:MAG TPA: serine/threonine-protein kinase [Kofleriaceae bacterium]|nr:serine/threonine-protein kinase [Kofleriaceae bacterium]
MDDEIDTAVDAGARRPPRGTPHPSGVLPTLIGRYHVLSSLGRGGMAEVFLAELRGPQGFRRHVAVKRLYPALADDPDSVARFVREATIATRLIHPAICHVYELDEDEHGPFMVMEHLDGITLSVALKVLSRSKWLLPVPIVLRIMRSLCSGLHAAHELREPDGTPLGLVHRDVTPSNIVLTANGQVKLLDFGVAKTHHISTQAGVVRGKPGYMSPEQILGRSLDRRSDIFSLGIVLYESVTGTRLFARPRSAASVHQLPDEHIPDPRAHRPDLPAAAVAVIDQALTHDRDERFPTASVMSAALAQALAPSQVASPEWVASMVHVIRERAGETTPSWHGAVSPS